MAEVDVAVLRTIFCIVGAFAAFAPPVFDGAAVREVAPPLALSGELVPILA